MDGAIVGEVHFGPFGPNKGMLHKTQGKWLPSANHCHNT